MVNIIKSISTIMYTAWHVDKYKITFKFVINSRHGIIDTRARYRAAARRLRNIGLRCLSLSPAMRSNPGMPNRPRDVEMSFRATRRPLLVLSLVGYLV